MHILYLHQHFAVPSGSTGTRSYEMARRWVKAGHRVTLICGRSDLCGLPPGDGRVSRLTIEGIDLRIVRTAYGNKQGFAARVLAFLSFMFWSFWVGLWIKEVDIIFATSTPLTIGIPALLLRLFKRTRYVFEIRDQWPQIPIEMGYIKNPILKMFLLWLEKRIYTRSAGIVALSPGMADGVKTALGKVRRPILVAPNSSDIDVFGPDIDGSAVRRELGWNDRFVVMHFGAMGRANGLDFLIDAADRLQDTPDIRLVLIGEGSEKERLRQQAAARGLSNIQVLDPFPKNRMPQVVAACDVSTVIFAKYPILEHNSANKFFDSLAAGKPILLNYGGWQRHCIEASGCGYGCTQCDLNDYVEKLKSLYSQRSRLAEMGRKARRLAESEFNRDTIASRILSLIESIVSGRSVGADGGSSSE
jgi:glycosyltransferase involved in cell wall biosynthesis